MVYIGTLYSAIQTYTRLHKYKYVYGKEYNNQIILSIVLRYENNKGLKMTGKITFIFKCWYITNVVH